MARGCRNKIASPYESEPQNNLQTIPLNTVFFVFFCTSKDQSTSQNDDNSLTFKITIAERKGLMGYGISPLDPGAIPLLEVRVRHFQAPLGAPEEKTPFAAFWYHLR